MDTQPDIDARCIYRIDSEHRIIFVNSAWGIFASVNDADHLRDENVLGTRLWDHIAGQETVVLYKSILERVARKGTAVRFPFRCDAPDTRRYLELNVARLPDGSYEFATVTLRTERRTFQPLLSASAERGDDFLRSCGWCKKIALSHGQWVEVEEGVRVLGLLDRQVLPRITHGICPRCQAEMFGEL